MGKLGDYLLSLRPVWLLHTAVTDWARTREAVSTRRGSLHLKAFLSTYRPAVIPLLEQVWATSESLADRFVVLALPESRNHQTYVQCLFMEDGRRILCEVDSGVYGPSPPGPEGPAFKREVWLALEELGFPLDPGGRNFQLMVDLGDGQSLDDVATILLKSLYLVCRARLGDTITWRAPLIANPDDLPVACALLDRAED